MTNRDSLILLTSQLSVGTEHKPFSPTQVSSIIRKLGSKNVQIGDLAHQDDQSLSHIFFNQDIDLCDEKEKSFLHQIIELLQREGSMAFAMMELNKWGIKILTKLDEAYPKSFLKHLGDKAPPLFYYAGSLSLLEEKYIGFTGSRLKRLSGNEEGVTKAWANHAIQQGYGIVSGGATGVDSFATQVAIQQGKPFVEFLSDSMIKRLQLNAISRALQNQMGLLLSETIPTAPFNVGMAMARNKYIYLLAEKVIAVKAEYSIKEGKKTGGTWNGAIENLKSNYPKLCVINDEKSNGNQELIEQGGIPLSLDPDASLLFSQLNVIKETPLPEEKKGNEHDVKEILSQSDFYHNVAFTKKEKEWILLHIEKLVSVHSLSEIKKLVSEKMYGKIEKKVEEIIKGKASIQTFLL
jgi:predicted Rossmann fold nucleotide-binding protein DprA/Smf involved in DNA uptake